MLVRTVTIIALMLSIVSCATNPVTGRSQFMIISKKQAISASSEADVKMLAPLDEKGKIDSDPALSARVNQITARLIAQAIKFRPETKGWDWRVKVIDDPETVNAFCMAGGKMAIYSGLILKLEATDDDPGVALAGASLAAALAIKLPNSRIAESESDVIGIELAARAGYDPNAAVSLWEKMAGNSGSSGEFEFFSTHPTPEKRIKNLRKPVPEMMPYYQKEGTRPVYPLKSGEEELTNSCAVLLGRLNQLVAQ